MIEHHKKWIIKMFEKTFPHWLPDDVAGLVVWAKKTSDSNDYFNDFLMEKLMLVQQKSNGKTIKPGYVRVSVENELSKAKKITTEKLTDGVITSFQEEFGSFDNPDSREKINAFMDDINKKGILSGGLQRLFDALVHVALTQEDGGEYKDSNFRKAVKHYLEKQEGEEITENNFNQQIKRIRGRIMKSAPSSRNHLAFVPYVDTRLEKQLLKILNRSLEIAG